MSASVQDSLKVETAASAVGCEAAETHLTDGSSPTGSSSSDISEVNTESLRRFTISISPQIDFDETTGDFQLEGCVVKTRANADQPSVDPKVTKSVHSVASEEVPRQVARAMASIGQRQEPAFAVVEYTHAYRFRSKKPTDTTGAAGGGASANTSSTRGIRQRLHYAEHRLTWTRTALVERLSERVVALLNEQVGDLETRLESSVADSDAAGSSPQNKYALSFVIEPSPEDEAGSTAFVTTMKQPPVLD